MSMNNLQSSIFNFQKRGFTPLETRSKGAADAKRALSLTGFTLIETMIAVTILTFAVAGPLYTASRAILAATISRDQLTASYLAQEGIEYVRALRDNEYLSAHAQPGITDVSGTAWNNFITGIESLCLSPASCSLDPVLRPMGYTLGSSVAAYTGAPLYLTNCAYVAGGLSCTPPNLYTEQNLPGSVQTGFKRALQVFHISATDERVVSTVSWDFHGTTYSVTVADHLTPWQ